MTHWGFPYDIPAVERPYEDDSWGNSLVALLKTQSETLKFCRNMYKMKKAPPFQEGPNFPLSKWLSFTYTLSEAKKSNHTLCKHKWCCSIRKWVPITSSVLQPAVKSKLDTNICKEELLIFYITACFCCKIKKVVKIYCFSWNLSQL